MAICVVRASATSSGVSSGIHSSAFGLEKCIFQVSNCGARGGTRRFWEWKNARVEETTGLFQSSTLPLLHSVRLRASPRSPTLVLSNIRQAGGGYALAYAADFFSGQRKLYPLVQVRELDPQHLTGGLYHYIASRAGGHAPENQNALQVIELCVVRDGVAEANADRPIDVLNMRFVGQFLQDFQFPRKIVGPVKRYIGFLRQADCSLLGEVL